MRSIGAPLAAEIASREKSLPYGLLLVLADGTRIRMTTLDIALTADVGDGAESFADGMALSDVTIAAGLASGSFEVSGPIGSLVTRAAILGGRFNRARASLFRASPNAAGIAAVMGGSITEARPEGGRFIFEIRSHEDRYNQTIGRVITPYCDAEIGDARCGFPVRPTIWTASEAVTVRADWDAKVGTTRRPTTFNGFQYECTTAGITGGTEPSWSTTLGGTTADGTAIWTAFGAVTFEAVVAAGTNALNFTVNSFPTATVDDQFNQGTVEFLTGALAGTSPVEVFDYVASSRTLTMFVPLAAAPSPGDTLLIKKGCSRTRPACRDDWRNTLNARAFFEVPGSDQVLKYAVPGSGGA